MDGTDLAELTWAGEQLIVPYNDFRWRTPPESQGYLSEFLPSPDIAKFNPHYHIVVIDFCVTSVDTRQSFEIWRWAPAFSTQILDSDRSTSTISLVLEDVMV